MAVKVITATVSGVVTMPKIRTKVVIILPNGLVMAGLLAVPQETVRAKLFTLVTILTTEMSKNLPHFSQVLSGLGLDRGVVEAIASEVVQLYLSSTVLGVIIFLGRTSTIEILVLGGFVGVTFDVVTGTVHYCAVAANVSI